MKHVCVAAWWKMNALRAPYTYTTVCVCVVGHNCFGFSSSSINQNYCVISLYARWTCIRNDLAMYRKYFIILLFSLINKHFRKCDIFSANRAPILFFLSFYLFLPFYIIYVCLFSSNKRSNNYTRFLFNNRRIRRQTVTMLC